MLPCFQLLNLSGILCNLTVYRICRRTNISVIEITYIYYMIETLTSIPTIFITVHSKQ